MVDKTIIILAAIVVIALISVGAVFISKKDNFNITTDPLRVKYEYDTTSTEKYPKAKRNGLNTENSNNVDICAFNDKFNSGTEFVQNENMDPCALTARQYCSVLYSHHQELFNNLYFGGGECEKAETEKCRQCPNKLNIKKENEVYYTQINRGV
jgi:uncharacterized protein YxeA